MARLELVESGCELNPLSFWSGLAGTRGRGSRGRYRADLVAAAALVPAAPPPGCVPQQAARIELVGQA